MNKDVYKAAISKIEASDAFKEKLTASMKRAKFGSNTLKIKHLIPVIAALIVIVGTSIVLLPRLRQVSVENNAKNDFIILADEANNALEVASYASIVYLDGYEYSPSSWLGYSRYDINEENYNKIKGSKLGEVTLDLKGKRYTGTPPDFSSTFDVGTEIYAIKDIKKESAVLIIDNYNNKFIFYRERKAVSNENEPLKLTISDVFNMKSNSPIVASVELRSQEDGSWMRTSENEHLLSLINEELPGLPLLNSHEAQNKNNNDNRIPINLIFKDGMAFHIQVYPEQKIASTFGGYINLSSELCEEIQKLYKLGEQYPSITEILPYYESGVSYLYFLNKTNGDEVLCKNPEWSCQSLFGIFDYYRVQEVEKDTGERLVITSTIGRSKDDSVTLNFYETEEGHIITEINGKYYKPVKGKITFKELSDYLYNSTDLGLKTPQ